MDAGDLLSAIVTSVSLFSRYAVLHYRQGHVLCGVTLVEHQRIRVQVKMNFYRYRTSLNTLTTSCFRVGLPASYVPPVNHVLFCFPAALKLSLLRSYHEVLWNAGDAG